MAGVRGDRGAIVTSATSGSSTTTTTTAAITTMAITANSEETSEGICSVCFLR